MHKAIGVWLLCCLQLICFRMDAQMQISFEHLTLRQGLSQSVPNAIHQDKEGFLWVGTQDGLNRYDGYTFKVFKNTGDDTTSLSHSWIWNICEDKKGNLWVASWNGLNRYDSRHDRFIRYDKPHHRSVSTRTNLVFCDSEGTLWASSWGEGLHRYDPITDRFDKVDVPENAGNAGFIREIYEDRDHGLWIATFGSGLLLLDAKTNQLVQSGPAGSETERFSSLTQDSEGTLWLGTNDQGIVTWHPDRGIVDRFMSPQLNDNHVTHLMTDQDNNIWVGTREGGINLYRDGKFTFWDHRASDEQSVSGSHIYSLYQDRAGIVWIGSTGLSKYDRRRKKFIHVTHQQNVLNSLSNRVVRTIFEDSKSQIWVGTEGGGLNLLDTNYAVIQIFRHDVSDPRSISSNDVRGIIENHDGTLWVATHRGGLDRFDPKTGRFLRYNTRVDYPPAARDIQHIMLDRTGVLWIGTVRDGVVWYDTKSDSFIIPRFVHADTVAISSGYVNRIDEDKDGNIWISGWGGGLAMRKPGSDTLNRYLHDSKRPKSLGNDIVYCMYQDQRGRMWLGTAGGLNLLERLKEGKFNSFDESVKLYTEKSGLANNVVYGILEDDSGKLWLSTNYGLSCFDPETEEFKNYHEDDGLQEEEFNANAFARCADGRLIFGGINGLNIFRPEELFINTNIPPVAITGMNIFEQPLREFQSGPIMLKYNQNFVSFEFVALDFMAPQRNSFAYRLEGLEDNWVMAGQRRYVSYTDLMPGTYTFQVKASNNDGIWNEHGASLTFTIASPFWMTPWFIAMVITIIILALYGIYRYRLEQKLHVERLRTKIAGDLHDEVGSSLTRISIYSDLLGNGATEDERKVYLSNIRNISREVVSTMSDIVWSIDNRSDTLGDMIIRMKDFAAQFLSPRNIEFEFTTANLEESRMLSPQVKQNIYLIFKEALNNIVKHAEATRVSIRIEDLPTGFSMRITDNGRGFGGDRTARGNGLTNMHRRADDIGAKFTMLNREGTTIVVECKSLS